MNDVEAMLIQEIERISGAEVSPHVDLFSGVMDSLSWVELMNVIDKIARDNGSHIDMDRLFQQPNLTINDIVKILSPHE